MSPETRSSPIESTLSWAYENRTLRERGLTLALDAVEAYCANHVCFYRITDDCQTLTFHERT